MADIDLYINAAPISLTVSAAQGPAGEAGSSTLSGLTDITYYDIPANNTPLSDALDGKISTLANVTLDNGNVIDPHTYSFPDISGEFLLDSSLPLAQSNVVDLVDDLALKAPLASPAITGTWTLNGVAQQDVSTGASVSVANLTASGTVTAGQGSFTLPSITFGDAGTGFYYNAANRIGVANAGAKTMVFYSAGAYMESGKAFGINTANWFRIGASGVELATTTGGGTLAPLSVSNLTASGTVTGKSFVEGVYDAGTPAGAGATLSLDNGSVQKLTLTAATPETITLPAVAAGATLIVEVLQAAGGTGTVTFQHADTTVVLWPGGVEPTMTPTASYVDAFSFVANHAGTKWRGTAAQNFQA